MLHDIFKYFGSIIIALGVISGIAVGANDYPILTSVIIVLGSIALGLFFIGFGAMLQSLYRIELKIAGERPSPVDRTTGSVVDHPSNVKK